MNPFWIPAGCSVCGGSGVTDSKGNAAQYRGGFISHRDPRICAEVLQRRNEKK